MEENHPVDSFQPIGYEGSVPNGDFLIHQPPPTCFYPPNSLHSHLSYPLPPGGNTNMAHFAPMYSYPPMHAPPHPFIGLASSSSTATSRQMLQIVQADYSNFYGHGPIHPSLSYPPPAAFHPPPMHTNDRISTQNPQSEALDTTTDGTQTNEECTKESVKETPQEVADAKTITDEESSETSKQQPTAKKASEDRPKSSAMMNKPKKQNNRKESRWLEMLERLKGYKEEFGDCIVPRGYMEDPRLASWVAEQRKQYRLFSLGKQSCITSDRMELLNAIGFTWNAQEEAWNRHKEELLTYRDEYGHCNVPLNYEHIPKLGLWVKEQRRHYSLMQQGKPSHMTKQRAAVLTSIGFFWHTHDATWMERFRELQEFKKEWGHCHVPANYAANNKLATWVQHQRRQLRRLTNDEPTAINKERIEMLRNVGFVWRYQKSKTPPPGYEDNDEEDSVTGNEENREYLKNTETSRKRQKKCSM